MSSAHIQSNPSHPSHLPHLPPLTSSNSALWHWLMRLNRWPDTRFTVHDSRFADVYQDAWMHLHRPILQRASRMQGKVYIYMHFTRYVRVCILSLQSKPTGTPKSLFMLSKFQMQKLTWWINSPKQWRKEVLSNSCFLCVCFCLSRLFLPSVRYSADIKMGGKAGPNSSVCSQQNARKSDLPTLSLLVRDKIWSLENKVWRTKCTMIHPRLGFGDVTGFMW